MQQTCRTSLNALVIVAGLLAILCEATVSARPSWRDYRDKPDDWYRSEEGLRVAGNILSWQSVHGSWPKNTDTMTQPFTGKATDLNGTFDNSATSGELRFLARAFRATRDQRYERAFLKGLDHILAAQYPNGGWPQYYPLSSQYNRHITFNDATMVRLMELLREFATLDDYAFIDADRRHAAQAAFDRGIQCILKCQIRVQGRLTVWCAQHDEVDYRPRRGRTYELPSLSGAESVGILQLLMSLDRPGPAIRQAVDAGAAWFISAQLTGIRQVTVDGDKRIVKDANAAPLWARFYDIESNRPIFVGRDGIKKDDLSQIESERRNGYAWYGRWGQEVARDYAAWKARIGSEQNVTGDSEG